MSTWHKPSVRPDASPVACCECDIAWTDDDGVPCTIARVYWVGHQFQEVPPYRDANDCQCWRLEQIDYWREHVEPVHPDDEGGAA